MTRRHFDALARVVVTLAVSVDARYVVARALAGYCAAYNDRFDRNRFLAACGVDTEE